MSEIDKLIDIIKDKQEMIFFLNTKSPKKHYHRVQELKREVSELKSELELKTQQHNE